MELFLSQANESNDTVRIITEIYNEILILVLVRMQTIDRLN